MAEAAARSLDDFFSWSYAQKRGFLHVCPVEDFDELALDRAEAAGSLIGPPLRLVESRVCLRAAGA